MVFGGARGLGRSSVGEGPVAEGCFFGWRRRASQQEGVRRPARSGAPSGGRAPFSRNALAAARCHPSGRPPSPSGSPS
eukprot:11161292-Lingulodinium_polyedra.AAC.1